MPMTGGPVSRFPDVDDPTALSAARRSEMTPPTVEAECREEKRQATSLRGTVPICDRLRHGRHMIQLLIVEYGCLVDCVSVAIASLDYNHNSAAYRHKPSKEGTRKRYAMARRPRRSAVARTKSKRAGKPATGEPTRAADAAANTPSAADLNLRDRLKAGPRRQAGPPLGGDTAEAAAMAALREESVPAATDPKNRRSRR